MNLTNQTVDKVNETLESNSTNGSFNQSADIEVPKSNVNLFNIVYTIVDILIVCAIFANGYRNR